MKNKPLSITKQRQEIKKLASAIPDENTLRRILSDQRDPILRAAIFEQIKPHLKFDVSHMYHN
jgi:hypothetical protein